MSYPYILLMRVAEHPYLITQSIVCLVGIYVARKRWNRHPRISRLTQTAFVLGLFITVITILYLPLVIFALHLFGNRIHETMGYLSLVGPGLNALAWAAIHIMLLIAIFSEREKAVEPAWGGDAS